MDRRQGYLQPLRMHHLQRESRIGKGKAKEAVEEVKARAETLGKRIEEAEMTSIQIGKVEISIQKEGVQIGRTTMTSILIERVQIGKIKKTSILIERARTGRVKIPSIQIDTAQIGKIGKA